MINTVDAQQAQMNKGYHPCGYGFYNFQCSKINDKYIATWNCSASCD
ncbi:MAG: hypothetical protein HWN81_00565 [Candidatus Lokiarchaeota archaeon]|nr:hypothetical protein [Candidatus Lokiarchaeota archaeon]